MRTKKIRLIANDARYRKEPYPSIATFNEKLGTYLTGQHIDPDNPSTAENLTTRQMTGEDKLTDSQKKKFGYIIIPETRINLLHLKEYDITIDSDGNPLNKKDYAEYQYLKYQHRVAPSKDKFISGDHYFYLEDKEGEAADRITKRELRYKAEKLIRENTSIGAYKDIVLLLNNKIKGFRVSINNMSDTLLQDKLYDACETNPEAVIDCFKDGSREDLFLLKCVENGYITKNGNSYYDGQQFLGDNLDQIKSFIRTNDGDRFRRRWTSLLAKKENSGERQNNSNDEESVYKELVADCVLNIMKKNYDKASDLLEQAQLINPNTEEIELLKKQLSSEIEKISKDNDNNESVDLSEYKKKIGEMKLDELKEEAKRLEYPEEEWSGNNWAKMKSYLISKFE